MPNLGLLRKFREEGMAGERALLLLMDTWRPHRDAGLPLAHIAGRLLDFEAFNHPGEDVTVKKWARGYMTCSGLQRR